MRLLCCALILLAGCVAPQSITPPVQTFVYNCAGGYPLTIREEGESLWLFLSSGTQQLSTSASEHGRLYSAAGIEFWRRGDEAALTIEGKGRRSCRLDRAAALWEDARFRGVDFRAAGNEPGWFVEIDSEKIVYAGNYGQQVLTFPAVPPLRDDHLAEIKYVSGTAEHRLHLLLQAGDCRDKMSDEMFSTRVTLKLDGKILYGCGRTLP